MGKRSIFGLEPDQLDEILSVVTGDLDESELDKAESSSPDHTDQSKKSQPAGATASLQGSMEQPRGQIGRYKLLNVLGEGGMGIVYLAEQQRPIKRRVALKVIKPGMDSKRVIARFEAERQALALLDHPNIAHVYDAGTTEAGRPYFVMEFVKGLSITEYCDHHKLSIEDRLDLFRQVCLAVQHAHQKGIIHRDIKPSNILVSLQDDQAVPKIIDFGVAKAIAQPLTERTLATEDSQLLGTPEYMSPEQADMASVDIDTRSDIYSLGVLLYVLLTGVLPFDSTTFREGGFEHIRQIIRETDPKTPSTRLSSLGEEAKKVAQSRRTEIATLAKKLHKELEWIPLKAMRKERAERYRSASELADDIENYQNGIPLMAGPPSTVYRLKKFVRRNQALVTGITTVLIILIAGVVVSSLFALRAQRQARISNAVSSLLLDDLLASVDPARGKGRDVTVSSFLDTTSESLDGGRFRDEPIVEALIRNTLGWTYRQLDECRAAESHLERAYQLRQQHLGAEHPDTLDSVNRLAWLRRDQGRFTEAAELLEEGLAVSRRSLGDEHIRIPSFANTLGIVYTDLGRYDEAEQLYLKNIPIALRVLGKKNNLCLFMVGNLGWTYEAQGRYDEAEHQYLECLRLREGFWDDENMWTLNYKNAISRLYIEQKRYKEAQRLLDEILPIQRRVLGDEDQGVLLSQVFLARVHTHLGEYAEAETLLMEVLDVEKLKLRKEHPWTLMTINDLGVLRREQKRYEQAESLLNQAIEGRERELGNDHPDTLESKNDLAVLYKEQARYEEAEKLLLEAVEGRRSRLGDKHPHTQESMNNLIALYEAWNKPEKAEEWRAKLPQTRIVEQ
ncbi:MAG: serine/threonine-protein kinase [Sedimentisphaerales bacterium]